MTTLLSFSSAGLLALLAIVIVLRGRRGGSPSLALGVMLLAGAQFFEHAASLDRGRFLALGRAVLVFEALVPVAFLAYGMSFHKRRGAGFSPLPFRLLAGLGLLFAAAALALPNELLFDPERSAAGEFRALGPVGYWICVGLLILSVGALVNLEAIFTSIRGADRWRVKYEFLGVGSALGLYILHFSQGLLYRGVATSLLSLRAAVLIVAVLLVGYSRLFRAREQRIVVSRQVIYRSFALVAVSLYLLGLGIVGQLMRKFGLSLDHTLVYFGAFLSGIAFLVLLFSEELRHRIRIGVTRHFLAAKHDYREAWLGLSNALAACGGLEDAAETVLEAYRGTFGLRSAALYVRDAAEESWSLAAALGGGARPARTRLSPDLLRYFTETGRVLDPDGDEYAPEPEEARFLRESAAWLLVPLPVRDRLEAFVVCGPQVVPEELTNEDFDLMRVIARQAASSLANFRLSEQLAAARELAAVAKVSSFVIHDLKNLAYTFSLMMENAEGNIGDEHFQRDLVRSIRGTVAKMNGLIAKLKSLPEKAELSLETADLAALARTVLAEVDGLHPGVRFGQDLGAAPVRVDVAEVRKVVLNLLLNACDALAGRGTVAVRSGLDGGEAWLSVEDDGCGMSPAFVEGHLFRPFRTTKEKGLGIGLYQSRQIVEAHGGRVEVRSREGEGTVFTVRLPGAGEAAARGGEVSA